MTVRIGFTLIGDGKWSGGLNYQRTLLQLLGGPLADRFEARVMVAPAQEKIATDAFGSLLQHPIVVDPRVAGAGVGRRALLALAIGQDRPMAALASEQGIDVMFENARFLGTAFPVPLLAWMPDFQHRHLAHLFPRLAWWKRDIGYRAQTRGKRVILLSSETARRDCERFYPQAIGRIAVARFAGKVDLAAISRRAAKAPVDHGLPEKFFYLPNHFWAHKNHAVVVRALQHVRKVLGTLTGFPPVVMSGPTNDPRDPGLFARMMQSAETDGLAPWFRHLGLIDFGDVLALNMAAQAVINPSLFEGWASSVEEGKSLGTPLILSALDVHREQAPFASFFDPDDHQRLAEILIATAAGPERQQVSLSELALKNAQNLETFATEFANAITRATSL